MIQEINKESPRKKAAIPTFEQLSFVEIMDIRSSLKMKPDTREVVTTALSFCFALMTSMDRSSEIVSLR